MDYLNETQDTNDTADSDTVIMAIVIVLLVLSGILDLACYRWRKVALVLFYLECTWALFDAVIFL